jgi:CRP/FNR family transcriptional regulator, cyclic AMP receptor protein
MASLAGSTGDGGENERPFMELLAADDAKDLRNYARVRSFAPGRVLFHQGEASNHVIVLTRGYAKVSMLTDDGREVVIGFAGAGDLIGELSALDGRPRSATVSAFAPTEGLVIALPDFTRFLETRPRVATLLLRLLAARLREADLQRLEFAAHGSVGRLAQRLVALSQRHGEPRGSGVAITLPITQEELAGWIDVSRESVAKTLHMLRDLDVIETHRRRIVVNDIEALERMAR